MAAAEDKDIDLWMMIVVMMVVMMMIIENDDDGHASMDPTNGPTDRRTNGRTGFIYIFIYNYY